MEVAKTAEVTGSVDNHLLQTAQSTNPITIPLYATLIPCSPSAFSQIRLHLGTY